MAIEHATKMSVPQCIAIVDEGCNLVAFFRMAGSHVLSIQSAQLKAMTAVSTGKPVDALRRLLWFGNKARQTVQHNIRRPMLNIRE